MTVAPTLNSKLRVLVAKTFRAERLYSSIRNTRMDKLASSSSLSELANDVRAKEWQKAHYKLRTALNDVLALGNNSAVIAEILQLRETFLAEADRSKSAVELGSETLLDTVSRYEFANVFRTSVDLIRFKARAQACRVISDELLVVLESSGKSSVERVKLNRKSLQPDQPWQAVAEENRGSNVIPLRREFAVGERSGR